jgi:hypothetical protein
MKRKHYPPCLTPTLQKGNADKTPSFPLVTVLAKAGRGMTTQHIGKIYATQ